jgi:hypothetical protein
MTMHQYRYREPRGKARYLTLDQPLAPDERQAAPHACPKCGSDRLLLIGVKGTPALLIFCPAPECAFGARADYV